MKSAKGKYNWEAIREWLKGKKSELGSVAKIAKLAGVKANTLTSFILGRCKGLSEDTMSALIEAGMPARETVQESIESVQEPPNEDSIQFVSTTIAEPQNYAGNCSFCGNRIRNQDAFKYQYYNSYGVERYCSEKCKCEGEERLDEKWRAEPHSKEEIEQRMTIKEAKKEMEAARKEYLTQMEKNPAQAPVETGGILEEEIADLKRRMEALENENRDLTQKVNSMVNLVNSGSGVNLNDYRITKKTIKNNLYWYAKKSGANVWICIGRDPDQAEEKIRQYWEKHRISP